MAIDLNTLPEEEGDEVPDLNKSPAEHEEGHDHSRCRPCLAGLHGRLRPEPCQTVVSAPASSLEPRLEHLAAYTGEEKSQNRGFVRLRGAAAPFAPARITVVAELRPLTHAGGRRG